MTKVLWIDVSNGNVRVAADKRSAQNFGNAGVIVSDENELADAKPISTGLLVELYNGASDKPVTKFTDRKTAARRVFALLTKADAEQTPVTEDATPAPEPKAKTRKTSGKGNRDSMSKPIYPADAAASPYRQGNKSFATYEMIKKEPGKTKAEYVAMGGRQNTINDGLRRGILTHQQ